ncbi:MAG: hypothetical protein AB1758_25755 [Candidatus Eremiobacterota bacterium]
MVGRSRGIGPLETIVAIGMISLVLMAVFTLCPSATLVGHRTETDVQAHELAGSMLEKKRAVPYADLTLGSETVQGIKVGRLTFDSTLEVRAGPTPNTRELRATVSWEFRGRPYQVVRSTLVADGPR